MRICTAHRRCAYSDAPPVVVTGSERLHCLRQEFHRHNDTQLDACARCLVLGAGPHPHDGHILGLMGGDLLAQSPERQLLLIDHLLLWAVKHQQGGPIRSRRRMCPFSNTHSARRPGSSWPAWDVPLLLHQHGSQKVTAHE